MAILMRLGPREEPLVGDLVEEYTTGRSRLWFWRQALAAVAAGAIRGIRDQPLRAVGAVAVGWAVLVTGVGTVWGPGGERAGKTRVELGSPAEGYGNGDMVAVPNHVPRFVSYAGFRAVGLRCRPSASRQPGYAAGVRDVGDNRSDCRCCRHRGTYPPATTASRSPIRSSMWFQSRCPITGAPAFCWCR